jgi:hypothetical protein
MLSDVAGKAEALFGRWIERSALDGKEWRQSREMKTSCDGAHDPP